MPRDLRRDDQVRSDERDSTRQPRAQRHRAALALPWKRRQAASSAIRQHLADCLRYRSDIPFVQAGHAHPART